MATQPTQNAVPSESPRDLKFNAGKVDEFVTSKSERYRDRLGGQHYTIEGLSNLALDSIASFGWITMDSFQKGAEITLPNQALRDETTGEYYRWDGDLPVSVSPGSTPESTGGVGKGAWISIGQGAISQPDGLSLVGSANYRDVRNYSGGGKAINVYGRENIFDGGTGTFHLDVSDSTSPDNDGTVLVDANGGRWKRDYNDVIMARWFGVKADGVTNDRSAFQKALDQKGKIALPAGGTVLIELSGKIGVNLYSGTTLIGNGCMVKTPAVTGTMINIPKDNSNIRITGIVASGAGSSDSDVNNLLFAIATVFDTSITTKAFSEIEVDHCYFQQNSFNIDIDIRSANGVYLHHNEHRGTLYSRGTGAVAGYQCHIASCMNVHHYENKHLSGGFDRHAFYVATAQSGINQNIHSHHNFYDWGNTDYTQNPFMGAINLRPGNNIQIHNEIINAPRGFGISTTFDSGNNFNRLSICYNKIINLTGSSVNGVDVGYVAGINLRANTGDYNTFEIIGNEITLSPSSDLSRVVGISVSGSRGLVGSNNIICTSTNQYGIQMVLACNDITLDGNQIKGDSQQASAINIDLQAALVRCKINDTNNINGIAKLLSTTGTPSFTGGLLNGAFPLSVSSNGSGSVTLNDPYGLCTSAANNVSGFNLSFDTLTNINSMKIMSQPRTANVFSVVVGEIPSVTAVCSVRNQSGSAMPAGSNSYRIDFSLVA